MKKRTRHDYDIEAVRKAAKKGTLTCFWIGEEPVFTEECVMDYLWQHGRYKPKSQRLTDVKE
jgi:hypothetical protein